MPSKERFQTRPMGRAFKRCLFSRDFLFRGRQQPKLRKLDVVFFSGRCFLADAAIEPPMLGAFKRGFTVISRRAFTCRRET